jgi:photosystem II stability/assembly factor-like uncharacterized protein
MRTHFHWLFSRACFRCVAIAIIGGTAAAGTWRPASLPFRPVCIEANQSVIWIGGVDEMLAKSGDGGATWQVKRQKTDGEVLLAVGFLDANTIYASGTNGIMEWSQDGEKPGSHGNPDLNGSQM